MIRNRRSFDETGGFLVADVRGRLVGPRGVPDVAPGKPDALAVRSGLIVLRHSCRSSHRDRSDRRWKRVIGLRLASEDLQPFL